MTSSNSDRDAPWHLFIDEALPCPDETVFETLSKQARAQASSTTKPRLIHLCGIPGSGKTTYAGKLAHKHPDHWHLQFDDIMQRIPDYTTLLETAGTVAAFSRWEAPAAQMGYRLLKLLVSEKRNILFDHSAANPLHEHLLDHCQAQGYHIEMHHLDVPISVAQARVAAREPMIGRHTPSELITSRHQLLKTLVPVYSQKVDRFVVVDDSSVTISDPAADPQPKIRTDIRTTANP